MLISKIKNLFLNKRIFNFIIYGIGQAVNLISPILVVPYIVSVCSTEGLGKIGVGFSFALIFNVLVDYGSYINGTKSISILRNEVEILKKKIIAIYLMKLILLLLFSFFAILLIQFIPFLNKENQLYYFSFLCVIGQVINPTWIYQGLENYKWISFINVSSKIIYVTLVFLLIADKNDYIKANAFLGLGIIISSIFGLIHICFKYKLVLYKGVLNDVWFLLKDEFYLTFSQLFLSFYQYFPIMLISAISGNILAGQFRIIDQVITVFRTYLMMFFNFVYADICLQFHNNIHKGFKNWFRYNILSFLLVIILILSVYTFSNEILLFFKTQLSDLATMKYYLSIGLILPVFLGISFALKQLMFALDKNRIYIKITIVSTILSLFLLYSLLQYFGLIGAFLSSICVEILIIIMYSLVLKSNFNLKSQHATVKN